MDSKARYEQNYVFVLNEEKKAVATRLTTLECFAERMLSIMDVCEEFEREELNTLPFDTTKVREEIEDLLDDSD